MANKEKLPPDPFPNLPRRSLYAEAPPRAPVTKEAREKIQVAITAPAKKRGRPKKGTK